MDVRILCLGVLARSDASGYEIRKAFEDGVLGQIQDAGFSSIYPALARLSAEKLVTVRTIEQSGRPPKKLYSITPKGRIAFVDALMTVPEPDRLRSDFLFLLLYAQLMPARRLAQVIESRLAELDATIARMEDCGRAAASAGERFVHGFGMAVFRAERAYLDEHRHEVLRESLLAELAVAE